MKILINIIITILIVTAVTFFIIGVLYVTTGAPVRYQKEYVYRDTCIQDNKSDCILNLMLSEGYASKPYLDATGHLTIGFGHQVRQGEKYSYMSFNEATELLQQDFNGCLLLAEELGYKNNQKLAIAHTFYCLGQGTTMKIINNGFEGNILRYCFYGKTFSSNIQKARIYEYRLFTKGY